MPAMRGTHLRTWTTWLSQMAAVKLRSMGKTLGSRSWPSATMAGRARGNQRQRRRSGGAGAQAPVQGSGGATAGMAGASSPIDCCASRCAASGPGGFSSGNTRRGTSGLRLAGRPVGRAKAAGRLQVHQTTEHKPACSLGHATQAQQQTRAREQQFGLKSLLSPCGCFRECRSSRRKLSAGPQRAPPTPARQAAHAAASATTSVLPDAISQP